MALLSNDLDPCQAREAQLFDEMATQNSIRTDKLFAILMVVQWIAGMVIALVVSPTSWAGAESFIHIHLWAAIFLGGLLSALPVAFAIYLPGRAITRHTIAISQALWGALLIHLTGGRIETHFHVFVSLAFISIYRDWRVILTMTIVVATDHIWRGYMYPVSVYGDALASPFRWVEHAAWVVFEDIVLVYACWRGNEEARAVCKSKANLEQINNQIESIVEKRTNELVIEKNFSRSVLNSIPSYVCVVDQDGKVEGTNAPWTRFVESHSEFAQWDGTFYADLCAAYETSTEGVDIQAQIKRVAEGQIDKFEHKVAMGGAREWFHLSATPLSATESGKVVVVHNDITDEVNAKQELMKTTNKAQLLAHVAKYTDNGVIITDEDSNVIWTNEGYTYITGKVDYQVLGGSLFESIESIAKDDSKTAIIESKINNREPFDVDVACVTDDGKNLWLNFDARPITDENGLFSKFIIILRDFTDRKEAEKEAGRLHRELNGAARRAGMAEVATGVLHNVGNVLNSVNVSTETLLELVEQSSSRLVGKAAEIVKENKENLAEFVTIHPQGTRLPEVLENVAFKVKSEQSKEIEELISLRKNIDHIKQIIAMQQTNAKSFEVNESIDPNEIVNDAIKMNVASSERHNVSLEFEPVELPLVETSKHEVLQILVNLIRNAIQATNPASRATNHVKITANLDREDFVVISVTDQGTGIAPENIEKIFQHGFTTKNTGHGFGLHTAANTAQSLGGGITAFSDGVGRGAIFELRIPVKNVKSITREDETFVIAN